MKSGHHRRKELARNEWYSPREAVEAARIVMGQIDLDPASSPDANEVVRAQRFYTVKEDGLSQSWSGRIWLNPPYGRFAPKFIEKFVSAYQTGQIDQACLLLATHHMTSKWFEILMPFDPIACLPTGRLQFSGTDIRPTHGSVMLGIGVDCQKFKRNFSQFGGIWTLC